MMDDYDGVGGESPHTPRRPQNFPRGKRGRGRCIFLQCTPHPTLTRPSPPASLSLSSRTRSPYLLAHFFYCSDAGNTLHRIPTRTSKCSIAYSRVLPSCGIGTTSSFHQKIGRPGVPPCPPWGRDSLSLGNHGSCSLFVFSSPPLSRNQQCPSLSLCTNVL
jgi:hypothetical protein